MACACVFCCFHAHRLYSLDLIFKLYFHNINSITSNGFSSATETTTTSTKKKNHYQQISIEHEICVEYALDGIQSIE